jgi:hypothetical protein
METRSIAIGLIAIVAAFAAAFGLAKSGGSKTETAGAGVKAQSIKLAAPAAVSGVEVGGTLPALKAERKAPAKKKKSTGTSNASTPSTNNTTPSTNTPSTTNSQPSNPQPSNPQPSNPQPSTPKPQIPAKGGGGETPAQGGGEDG